MKKTKAYPTFKTMPVEVFDHSEDVASFNGTGKGTMLASGWHSNSADISGEGFTGRVVCIGASYYIEVNSRRFHLDLTPIVEECVQFALENPKLGEEIY